MIDKELRPNKPGRWWIKFKSVYKPDENQFTVIYEVREVDGKLKITAEQYVEYEGYCWYNFPLTEKDRTYASESIWETMELKDNNRTVEYCYPLMEKPPWEK